MPKSKNFDGCCVQSFNDLKIFEGCGDGWKVA